jgi:hypothetical protein
MPNVSDNIDLLIRKSSTNRYTGDYTFAASLPAPTANRLFGPGSTAEDVLRYPFLGADTIALIQRLSANDAVDRFFMINALSECFQCDDPSTTAHNAMVLLEFFTAEKPPFSLMPTSFAHAVSGLSHHKGKGSETMHRLNDPNEIRGAAAVIQFVITMDREGMVKLSKLKHPESLGVSGLTITNKYLDQHLRSHPEHLGAVCGYLNTHRIDGTKKSVQPLLEYLAGGGAAPLINGAL